MNTIAGVFTDLATNQYLKSKEEYFIELELLTKNELRCDNLFEKAMLNEKQLISQFHFQIPQGGKYLPKYKMSDSEKLKFDNNNALFWNLINKGLLKKISVNDREKYIERIGIEYDIIELGGFVDYFLILWDIIRWSNENGILSGIGRGSAGGSLIAYLLNITRLDPIKYDLLFERFLNKGRVEGGSLPDIDCDFAGNERECVKQYMEQKYGQAHVCSVGSYNTLQIKAAIKDLSRLKNLDIPYVNLISNKLEECNSVEDIFKKALTTPLIYEFIQDNADIINDLMIIRGAPRSESIHPCATIILPDTNTIYDWIPVKTVTTGNKDTILVSSWEGSELESIGLLKEDILGIRQLDKFQFILNLIEKKIDIYNIDFNEKRVYEYFCEGWTSDVFHFGAKGLTKYCKESQPHNIDDLIAAIALYRPGPIESDLHNEYVRRKNGDSPIEYLWGTKHITKDTYGILIYQEQIMQVCTDVGGFSLMESDDIRRAMGKKKPELLESYKNQFIENAINKGCHNDDAHHTWDTLEKFASYGFNKCISGDEKIKRFGIGENSFYPTIKDMWMIKNDSKYAWSINKNPLHQKYKYIGYGFSYSLNERGLLIKNKIKDIRYVGVAPIYRMILENDTKIDVTLNHKFPTSNGEKMLMDIDIDIDKIYFNIGYKQEKYIEPLLGDGVHNSEKGVEGFVKKKELSTEFLKLRDYKLNHKKNFCEYCHSSHNRLEVHHKDGNHGNNELANLITLCPSCHKKEHYKLGRTRIAEKGLYTKLLSIKSIEYLKDDEVFDVEMEHPNHTFVIENGIVTSNSHAAAYTLTAYICNWFKVHYPIEFWTSAFEFLPESDREEKTIRYISEIKNSGRIQIIPVDINKSKDKIFADKSNSIYWSFNSIKNIAGIATDALIDERNMNGDFFSFDEFLSRFNTKGSKINKTHIEHLIVCGAFDKIEGIGDNFLLRLKLIEYYREKRRVKIDKEKDIFVNNDSRIYENWWWQLYQKQLSGLSFFNYKDLTLTYLQANLPFLDSNSFQDSRICNQSHLIGGYIVELNERTSKNSTYCIMKIESNYQIATVIVMAGIYGKIKSILIEGALCLFTGYVKWNDFYNENVIKIDKEDEIVLLNLK